MAKDLEFYKSAFEIAQVQSWDRWHEDSGWSTDEKYIDGLGFVNVVHRKNDDRDRHGYEWDHALGSTDELSVTFQVTFDSGDLRYFRKYGYANSYGDPQWDGKFVEVHPAKQTVVVFEED